MMRFLLPLLLLAACAAPQDPARPDTSAVATEVVERILAMNCQELAATEALLNLVEQGQSMAGVLIAAGVAPGLRTDILGQTETARRQTQALIDFMQVVRFCGQS